MAERKYKSLIGDQKDVALFLQSDGRSIIDAQDVVAGLQLSSTRAQRALERLAQQGFLHRIQRGLYCLPTFRDEMVIANRLMPGGAIAYWSALHRHGMTVRFPNSVFVQSPRQKPDMTVFGVKYRFIKVKQAKLIGHERQGFRDAAFMVTDREKTIVDCFDLPEYAGGFDDLIRALATGQFGPQKLVEYAKAIGNQAAAKRMAVIIELAARTDLSAFLNYARTDLNPRYALFNKFGPDEGEFDWNWRVRMNISKEAVMQIISSHD